MNDLFGAAERAGITVVSLRNKANRLEELFMRLVENKQDGARVNVRLNLVADQDDHPQGNHPRAAHLGADDRAAGDHDDAVLHHLRQPHRPAHRPDGRHRLHGLHRPGPDHDVRDHELLRQRRVVVLRREVRPSRRRDARVADVERGDHHRPRCRRRACAACSSARW